MLALINEKTTFYRFDDVLNFSTYTIQENFKFHKKLIIQQIIIDNNYILNEDQLREKLSFLYGTNIFFLKTKNYKKN